MSGSLTMNTPKEQCRAPSREIPSDTGPSLDRMEAWKRVPRDHIEQCLLKSSVMDMELLSQSICSIMLLAQNSHVTFGNAWVTPTAGLDAISGAKEGYQD